MRKLAGVFIVCLCAATAMAADFTGTWKLNLQKSKLNHANIASETMTIEQTGPNSYRTSQDITLTSGEKHHGAINRVYDGKEHAVAAADSTGHDSEICESVTGGRKITMKKDGKVVTIINSTVSADGQTLTNNRSNADGEVEVLIFDREK
jgi:hypothetical protein